MSKFRWLLILPTLLLAACASQRNIGNSEKTQQNIDAAMLEASEVQIPQVEPISDEILDELMPGRGVLIPELSQEVAEASFDLSVSNAPARLFFMSLVRDTGVNMVVHPSVAGEISLDLNQVTVAQVMKLMREVYGYEYKKKGSNYIVLPARIQSRIFAVNYLNITRSGESKMVVSSGLVSSAGESSTTNNGNDDNDDTQNGSSSFQSSSINTQIETDFWTDLSQTLKAIVGNGEGRSVVVDRHAGLTIVRAMPGELRDVEAYLENAQDSLQRQVILETKIIEVRLRDSFQSGIDWAALSSSGDVFAGTSSVVSGTAGVSSVDALGNVTVTSPLVTGSTGFGNLFTVGGSSSTFGALITLLSTQGDVRVLSSPRVSTVNNQKAVIKVGSDEYFVTEVSSNTSTTSSSTTTNPDITLTPFFSGIALDVTPQISEDNEVILHIHPTVSEVTDQTKTITVAGQTQQLPLAFSTVRESDSVVKAASGQVVVIGGLMQNSNAQDNAGLPGMKDIPLIGNLFKQKRQTNARSELVILMRPIVVGSNKVWSNYIKDSAGRMKQLKSVTEDE